jgi:hypothetical protein
VYGLQEVIMEQIKVMLETLQTIKDQQSSFFILNVLTCMPLDIFTDENQDWNYAG